MCVYIYICIYIYNMGACLHEYKGHTTTYTNKLST